MEIWVSVNFNCPAEDEALWREIFEGLEQYEAGAALQERIEFFGAKAEAKIDEMMDVYDMSCWYVEEGGWSVESGQISFGLEGGAQMDDFSAELAELLPLCRATNIKVEPEYEE